MEEQGWERIVIEEEIGCGSFGTVYRAELNGKKYAVKQISVPRNYEEYTDLLYKMGRPEKVKECCRQNALALLKEVRIQKKFKNHPNIVSVLDYRLLEREEGYDLQILMEYLEPFTSYEITHVMTEKEVVSLGIDICRALEACEEKGILHRDIKLENILVAEDGTFKLCDFGSAEMLRKAFVENSVEGSFAVMAPEVYNGKKYDNRADIYSLGMILYRSVNRGREPGLPMDKRMVSYKDKEDALNRRMNGEPLPAPVDASEELTEILLRACAYAPEDRYGTAAELKKDLFRLQNGRYRKKKILGSLEKSRRMAYARTAAAILLLGIAWHSGRNDNKGAGVDFPCRLLRYFMLLLFLLFSCIQRSGFRIQCQVHCTVL